MISRPRKRSISRLTMRSCASRSARQPRSPISAARRVESTMSVNSTEASTRSGSISLRAPVRNSSISSAAGRRRRPTGRDRILRVRHIVRRGCAPPDSARLPQSTRVSPWRCRTSVGTRIAARMWRTSIWLFMRISVITADGLAPSLSKRAHHCLKRSSSTLLGANALRAAPLPHDASTLLRKASNRSGGNTHVGKCA